MRKQSAIRRAEIHHALLAVAEQQDYRYMTREAVANYIGVAAPLINAYVGNAEEMRELTVALAVSRVNLIVIAQALSAGHPAATSLDMNTKLRAAYAYARLHP